MNILYIRCIFGIFGREITKYTVIYGVYIQFWPSLQTCCGSYRANPPAKGVEDRWGAVQERSATQGEITNPQCIFMKRSSTEELERSGRWS